MSNTIYGIIDKKHEIISCSSNTEEDWLFNMYDKKNMEELNNIIESEYNQEESTDEYENLDDYKDYYYETYFPKSDYSDYEESTKQISLKKINFTEKIWQNIMIYFDNKYNFPAKNLCLVSIEESNEDSLQRVDLLYIRSDGKLLPAEIKISDNGRDVHGQLIRYMAGFSDNNFTKSKIINMAKRHLPDNVNNLQNFISKYNISDEKINPIETTGLLICEEYHNDTIKAIRYLNEKTNIDIKMYDIDLFVNDKWNEDIERFIFKVDLNEIV